MSGDTQTNVIINDNTAKWLVIVFLGVMAAYAVVKADSNRDDVLSLKEDYRSYRNDISVWETDVFNRQKTLEAMLVARGVDTSKLEKLRPPPEH